jgi:uncharacterized membrane protein
MSNRNITDAAPQMFAAPPHGPQVQLKTIVKFLRIELKKFAAWRRQRRDRKRLYEYLASDHRVAADIGYPHRLP